MKKICALFILVVLILFSCGKDKVKPSDDSLLGMAASDSIYIIKAAYQGKDTVTLQNHLAPELLENIQKNLFFEKAELSLNPRMVWITDLSVRVNLNWQGTWWFAKDKNLMKRGVANFVLQRETMKLIQIDGDNPFIAVSSDVDQTNSKIQDETSIP